MASRKPETRLVRDILEALRRKGGFWYKVHGGPFQRVGLPDIIGCYKGRFVAIEVKCPGNKPTLIQQHVIGQIREAGGTVGVAYNVSQALSLLKTQRRKNNGKREEEQEGYGGRAGEEAHGGRNRGY